MTGQSISVGLSSWIIQDGNYGEFYVGVDAAFALEFYPAAEMRRVEGSPNQQLTRIAGSEYMASGRVIHVADDWWAVDFGFPAYRAEKPPENLNAGDHVQGEIYLGIDPFFYFERIAFMPGAPALIMDWYVENIEIQTAPFIRQGSFMVRDAALIGWRYIAATDAWKDDGGSAEYVLTCKRTTLALRHSIATQRYPTRIRNLTME
jgi:hypothetical protein